MKKICYLLSVICYLPFAAHAAKGNCMDAKSAPTDILTLVEVVRLGLCRNPQTAAAYLSVESARLSKNAGYAPYLPSVDASVSASKQYRNKAW
ncbi:MAG: hypothetical protein LBJ18_02670, partial [Rickettsiales bacterium]|nr:hypothetical protein [Rickettsiales bacterium]